MSSSSPSSPKPAKASAESAPDAPPAKKPIVGHVISNTHWDREWRYPFQAYRTDLVDLIDRLLDVMEKRKDYKAFLLDAQTVILEDYLEIRPENAKRIRKLSEAGRLQLGPWYTLPDAWGCHGEALVRNLLLGHRMASEFGPVLKAGYTPFNNGQISQFPQLLKGFGIDSCFYYRGIGKHVAKCEFYWDSPDGSRVIGFRFGDYARYNYYYLAYRPGLLGRGLKDREYQWDPAEIGFHVANEVSWDRQYGWIAPQVGLHPERVAQAAKDVLDVTVPETNTRHLLYMMGHDHSFALEEELDLIEALAASQNPAEYVVQHGSILEYLDQFKAEAKDLEVLQGEMRHTNKQGLWTNLMALILSCRLYLKQRNARINTHLLYAAEPLAAFAALGGSEYPSRYLELAWKRMLKNHAHDAIGGCSTDKVHEEMLSRWSEAETISEEVVRRSLRDLASRIDGSAIPAGDLQLSIFNTQAHARHGVAEFTIDLPGAVPGTSFCVELTDGTPVPIQVLSSESYQATIEGGYELPMPLGVQRHRTLLDLPEIPGFSHLAIAVKPNWLPVPPSDPIVRTARTLENEFLRAEISDIGTIRLTDKRSGHVIDNLGLLEDTAEFGDPWNRVTPPNDRPILSNNVRAQCYIDRSGDLEGRLKIVYGFPVPAAKYSDAERLIQTVELPVTMYVSLKKGAERLDVTYEIENRARDHRLRVLFPSGVVHAEVSSAEGQFDVNERPIRLPDPTGWKEPPYPTHPMWNFVDVSDGERGFAVINDGLTEYQVFDDAPRTIAITLLRAFGKFVFGRPTPGSQCLGRHVYRFSLVPHAGNWLGGHLFRHVAEHTLPLQAIESAPTRGKLPPRHSYLSLQGRNAVFSGVKLGEDGKSFVVRFWNPSERPEPVAVRCASEITAAAELTLEEKVVRRIPVQEHGLVELTAPGKKIVTVALTTRPAPPQVQVPGAPPARKAGRKVAAASKPSKSDATGATKTAAAGKKKQPSRSEP